MKPQTAIAFDDYVRAAEQGLNQRTKADPFLWLDGLEPDQRGDYFARVRRGEVVSANLNKAQVTVSGGMIQHWVTAAFVPNKKLSDVQRVLQDYDHQVDLYGPDVVKAKLLRRDGNHYSVYERYYKRKVISVYLDTYYDGLDVPLGPKRLYSWSHSTRIQEVENAGTAEEKLKPEGHDSGLMWRLNSYWRLDERDGGVYMECEAISLTRDIPLGVKWLVQPFLTNIPHESLERMLRITRDAAAK